MSVSSSLAGGHRVAVAYSGGRDSTALLHATVLAAHELGDVEVVALHVHHGLNPMADAWLAHAEAQCAAWAAQGWPVSLRTEKLRLRIAPGDSLEAVARQERYEALAAMAKSAGCDTVLLAHHRRDQAETFLLQALRGAGVAGLASMPRAATRDGIAWLRPWLDHPRSAIEAYVAAHALPYVDDGSNEDRRHARNRLRLDVWPGLTQAFGQSETVLAQAASHQADVLACLEDWLADKLPLVTRMPASVEEAGEGHDGQRLDVAAWRSWADGPQRELLRAWFRKASGHALTNSWVRRLHAEVTPDGVGRWPVVLERNDGDAPAQGELVLYRGLLRWRPVAGMAIGTAVKQAEPEGAATPSRAWPLHITGPGRWPLPNGLGHLMVTPLGRTGEAGLPLALLHHCELRLREGQERFQFAMNRPARGLKKQFQMLGVPAWERAGPLLWAQGQLLFVAGLGIHAPARATSPGQDQVLLHWEPPASAHTRGQHRDNEDPPDQDSIKVTE